MDNHHFQSNSIERTEILLLRLQQKQVSQKKWVQQQHNFLCAFMPNLLLEMAPKIQLFATTKSALLFYEQQQRRTGIGNSSSWIGRSTCRSAPDRRSSQSPPGRSAGHGEGEGVRKELLGFKV